MSTPSPVSPADAPIDRADAFVLFGLTGDLGSKKLFPAIYELAAAGRLTVPVIGVGRTDYSDADLRTMFGEALAGYEPTDDRAVDHDIVDSIDLSYVAGDSTDAATYDRIAELLPNSDLPVVYAALPPSIFGSVAKGIASSTLPERTRLVVEKPFGADATSARELYDEITDALSDEQLFIVDHFLAKASIENMSIVRHANPLIDNSLRAEHVSSIDIVMSETGGVDGRGSFYEGVGAVNDVVQNHLLQTLAMVTMPRPSAVSDGRAGDDVVQEPEQEARRQLLASVPEVDPSEVVLGQYRGYRDLDDVDDDSTVETFVSLRLAIETQQWRGVPITIRTGKHLAETRTEVIFTLHDSENDDDPRSGSDGPPPAGTSNREPNRVRFTVKPDASVALDISVIDVDTHRPTPATVYACGPEDHGALGDYAVMFDNAFDGDRRHFAHIDGIVEAWRILAPLLDDRRRPTLVTYEPGLHIDEVGTPSA